MSNTDHHLSRILPKCGSKWQTAQIVSRNDWPCGSVRFEGLNPIRPSAFSISAAVTRVT
jgi:hypothetical protein